MTDPVEAKVLKAVIRATGPHTAPLAVPMAVLLWLVLTGALFWRI